MTLKQKLAAVRMVMLDVDGVLSDGKIFYDDKGNELKSFHVHDGFGIARARKQGISFALISGRKSTIVSRRSKELHINDVFQGITDKVAIVDRLRRKYSLKKEQVCCMADDAHDIEFLQSGGLSVAPANARRSRRDRLPFMMLNVLLCVWFTLYPKLS